MPNFALSQFGPGGVILRARGMNTLAVEEIRARVPSVFAEHAHDSRSARYAYIPTVALLDGMATAGFSPVEVRQGGTRHEEKRGFTKHMIRFRQLGNLPSAVGDAFPEIALLNSHDGTSSYQILSAWVRLACLNGMVVNEAEGPSIRVPHRGNVDDVIEASFHVLESFPRQAEKIGEMQRLALTGPEQVAFATAASHLRFSEAQQVQPESLLSPQRREDAGNSLWTTFSRIQEHVIRGGVRTVHRNGQGKASLRRARPINSITEDVHLNQALWSLTEEMRKIKAA